MRGRTGGVSVESAEALLCNRVASIVAKIKASMANNICIFMLRRQNLAKDLVCMLHYMEQLLP